MSSSKDSVQRSLTATESMNIRREEAVRLHMMEEEAMSRVRINRNSTRPANTNTQYSARQLEFFHWNSITGYSDEHMTEAKMVLFLSHIQGRPVRQRGRQRKRTLDVMISANDADDIDEISSVGYHTVAAYVNALMDVWRLQYELGNNPRIPIRPTSVKELLRQKNLETVEHEDAMFVDRGKGTMVDSVDPIQLKKVSDSFFFKNTETGLKHRADNLMSLALCSRGDNMRGLKLSTIGLICFENEGVRGCKLLRCVWRK
jgi:hypothetical protein